LVKFESDLDVLGFVRALLTSMHLLPFVTTLCKTQCAVVEMCTSPSAVQFYSALWYFIPTLYCYCNQLLLFLFCVYFSCCKYINCPHNPLCPWL